MDPIITRKRLLPLLSWRLREHVFACSQQAPAVADQPVRCVFQSAAAGRFIKASGSHFSMGSSGMRVSSPAWRWCALQKARWRRTFIIKRRWRWSKQGGTYRDWQAAVEESNVIYNLAGLGYRIMQARFSQIQEHPQNFNSACKKHYSGWFSTKNFNSWNGGGH